MIYSDWVNEIAAVLEYQAELEDPTSATPFSVTPLNNVLPRIIDYVENRIQRDLDLLATVVTDDTGTMTANSRKLALPTDAGVYVVATRITPIVSGVRQVPLEPVSRAFLDFAWPSDTSPGANILPVQWCPYDQAHVLVGPAPDQAYGFEVVGTQRLAQLSASNVSNFLTLQLADLYVAATNIWLFGFQRDFGAQAEDPKAAQSWENQYQLLLKSATVEEARKQYMNMFQSPSKPTGLTSQSQAAA